MERETDLHELPKGWIWVKVGEIIESVKGKKPNKLTTMNGSQSIPYINIEAFEKKVIRQFTNEKQLPMCEAKDVLIVWDGARCGWVGTGATGVVGSTLAKLKVKEMSNAYLFYFMKTKFQYINQRPRGVGIPHVEPTLFREIPFPIPPLLEQHRIVTKIEELFTRLDDGVAELKKVQLQLKRYRQSILKSAFDGTLTAEWREEHKNELEPASILLEKIRIELINNRNFIDYPLHDSTYLLELPESWQWVPLVSLLIEPLRNGHSAKSTTNENGIRTLTLTAVTTNDFSEKNTKITKADKSKVKNLWLRYGDIFVERSNTREYVGLSAIYLNEDNNFAIFPDLLIRVRVNSKFVNPKFVGFYLRSSSSREYFKSKAQGISGTMPKIDQEVIEKVQIPLPSISEQNRIVREIERDFSCADEIENSIQQSLKQAERLRQSILKKAFEGKLVPQDPEDEPADKLLERIKVEKEKTKMNSKQGRAVNVR